MTTARPLLKHGRLKTQMPKRCHFWSTRYSILTAAVYTWTTCRLQQATWCKTASAGRRTPSLPNA